MKSCYAFVIFFPFAVALTVSYLPVRTVPSRLRLHLVEPEVFAKRNSLLPTRKGFSSFHCKRQECGDIIARETNDGGACIAEDKPNISGVTLKMAFDSSSVWGVADLSETKSERFTSQDSLDMVHRLRRESSAVLVGRGTVERDDCSLTVRRVELGDGKRQPVRVVIDPSLILIGGDFTILNDGVPTIVYYLHDESTDEKLNGINYCDSVSLVGLSPSSSDVAESGKFSISPLEVIKDLANRGLRHIMVEGGPTTARAFLDEGVVDRAILVRAPLKFRIPVPAQMGENTFQNAGLQKIGIATLGGDTVEYWTRKGMPWPHSEICMWP